jgi:hypothetical protein
VYFITLRFLVRKIFTFYINDMLLFKCPFPGPKVLKDEMKEKKVSLLGSTLHLNTETFCDIQTNGVIAKHESGISFGRMLDYDLGTNLTRVIPWEAQNSFSPSCLKGSEPHTSFRVRCTTRLAGSYRGFCCTLASHSHLAPKLMED